VQDPAAFPAFETSCGNPDFPPISPCSVTECSCTDSGVYCSSTPFTDPSYAWVVDFDSGGTGGAGSFKYAVDFARAVRGGA